VGLDPGPWRPTQERAHTAGTKELLQVQRERITVEVAERSVTLDSGDAVAFPGVVAHSYANPGAQPARFSLAVFEPGVGSGIPGEAVDA
jgi:mannose-6-phosphate isomerase-like protein (cupin superfamily)